MTGCGGVDEGTAVAAIIQGVYTDGETQIIITASQLTVINYNSSDEFLGNICFEIEYRFVEVGAQTTPAAAAAFDYHSITLFRADDRKEIATINFTFDEATLALTIPAAAGIGAANHNGRITPANVITVEFGFMSHMIPGFGSSVAAGATPADTVFARQ